MASEDWRSPAPYEELRDLDAPGFAWEYLRRNAQFNKERISLEEADRQGALKTSDADDFARRWGVRFRRCASQDDAWHCPLDRAGASHCHCRNDGTD
ncbi:hypothetical protein GCM10011611_16750 [Aliidongia dinghuensis]|uniref:Transcriptional regulator-like domain-containing protein n=2 Tax=Aliidongia dinghuensis TaxID=1867774 RepID=A0A8J2YRK0_9PROT|nr:hypothetical protein GCM10011611_16750 [Aliidongia dinghuensis]